MNVLEKIRNQYKDFSKVNKKIADFILRDPSLILSYTAVDIAQESKTSPASIIRFTKSLGFSGLEAFKLSIAAEKGIAQNKKVIDPIISNDDSVIELSEKVGALINSTMDDLLYIMDEEQVALAIQAIKRAETVYLLGIGASSLTAYNLYHKLNRAGKKAVYNFTIFHFCTAKQCLY